MHHVQRHVSLLLYLVTLQVMTAQHGMFERQMLILRAGEEPFTEEDHARLEVRPSI